MGWTAFLEKGRVHATAASEKLRRGIKHGDNAHRGEPVLQLTCGLLVHDNGAEDGSGVLSAGFAVGTQSLTQICEAARGNGTSRDTACRDLRCRQYAGAGGIARRRLPASGLRRQASGVVDREDDSDSRATTVAGARLAGHIAIEIATESPHHGNRKRQIQCGDARMSRRWRAIRVAGCAV